METQVVLQAKWSFKKKIKNLLFMSSTLFIYNTFPQIFTSRDLKDSGNIV